MAALMHERPLDEPRLRFASADPVARFFALEVVPSPDTEVEQAPPRTPLRVIPGGREAALRRRLPAEVYRRRRVMVLVGVLLLALTAAIVLGVGSHAAGTATDPVAGTERPAVASPVADATGTAPETYVVQSGDTLWSIAEQLAPGDDPRPLVAQLADLNGGTPLEAGARLDLSDLPG